MKKILVGGKGRTQIDINNSGYGDRPPFTIPAGTEFEVVGDKGAEYTDNKVYVKFPELDYAVILDNGYVWL